MKLLIMLSILTLLVFGFIYVTDKNRKGLDAVIVRINGMKPWTVTLCLFLGCFILDGLHIFYKQTPFVADEVYTLSGGAFFAGYDWSSYMSLHKFYNFGYTMLLAPLFRLFQNPVSLYRSLLTSNVVLECISIVLVYRILRLQLKADNVKSILLAVASSASALILQFHTYVYNEMPLTLLVWLALAIMIRLVDAKGIERIILSLVLGFFVGYTYLIHSRCVILFVTVALIIVLYLLLYRAWICNPILTGASFATTILVGKKLIDYVQVHLYQLGLSESMNNSVEDVVSSTGRYENLKSIGGIIKVLKQFLSLAGALNIATGGLLLILTIVSLYCIVKYRKMYVEHGLGKQLFILTVFGFVGLWGTVACIALVGAMNGYPRFMAYSRYFTPFFGPFLLLGILMLFANRDLKKPVLWGITLFGDALVALVYLFYSYPVMKGTSMKQNASLYMFLCFSRYEEQVRFSKNVFIIAFFVMIAGSILFLLWYQKRRILPMCVLLIGFSCSLFYCIEERQNRAASARRYEMSNASYALLESGVLDEVEQINYGGSGMFSKAVLVTLFNRRVTFVEDLNAVTDLDNQVILTDMPGKYLKHEEAYIYQLDKNEFIMTTNEGLSNELKESYEAYEVPEEENPESPEGEGPGLFDMGFLGCVLK